MLVRQVRAQSCSQVFAGGLSYSKDASNRRDEEVFLGNRSKRDEEDATTKVLEQLRARLKRNARLTGPTRASECQQTDVVGTQ